MFYSFSLGYMLKIITKLFEKNKLFANEQYLVIYMFITIACKDGQRGRQGLSHDHHLLKSPFKCSKYVTASDNLN